MARKPVIHGAKTERSDSSHNGGMTGSSFHIASTDASPPPFKKRDNAALIADLVKIVKEANELLKRNDSSTAG